MDIHSKYHRIRKAFLKNSAELLAVRDKLYPEFIYDSKPKSLNNEIPVFTLHSVQKENFEEILSFLQSNEYRTLDADELYRCLTEDMKIPERSLVLTFDDGWRNLYTIVYPLLKKYNQRAVSFIIPGLVDLYSTWSEPFSAVSKKEVIPDSASLCSWEEIKEMHTSNVIDFQSHSMHHLKVFTSFHIDDFYHPAYDNYPLNLNIPLYRINGKEQMLRKAEFGMPVYRHESVFSGKPRYFENEDLTKDCINYVKANGGIEFFRDTGWRKALKNIVNKYARMNDFGHFGDETDLKEQIYWELYESKLIIEKKLEKQVNHFCFPWWAGSTFASELSHKAGYLSNFWGILKEKKSNKPGGNPFRISRFLSEDFIFRLPGIGRKSLFKIHQEKFLENSRPFINQLLNKN